MTPPDDEHTTSTPEPIFPPGEPVEIPGATHEPPAQAAITDADLNAEEGDRGSRVTGDLTPTDAAILGVGAVNAGGLAGAGPTGLLAAGAAASATEDRVDHRSDRDVDE